MVEKSETVREEDIDEGGRRLAAIRVVEGVHAAFVRAGDWTRALFQHGR